jgi:hypothetical protein
VQITIRSTRGRRRTAWPRRDRVVGLALDHRPEDDPERSTAASAIGELVEQVARHPADDL